MIPPYHWWRTVFFLIPAIAVYTIVLGTMLIFAAMFLLVTLAVDILYTFVDPRIRY